MDRVMGFPADHQIRALRERITELEEENERLWKALGKAFEQYPYLGRVVGKDMEKRIAELEGK